MSHDRHAPQRRGSQVNGHPYLHSAFLAPHSTLLDLPIRD